MMINVKNHHMPPTILVDKALGISSEPAGLKPPLEKTEEQRKTEKPLAYLYTLLHKRSNSKPYTVD